jgi:hypothetical protein
MKEIINYATPENKEPMKVHLPKLNYQLCHFYYNNRNWYLVY